ncbi:MAG: adenine-specific methyltransferase EcoRI family protein [Bacteroidota bacterium]|nr:adenine-specific methyltransferase EcoRI family protein [Bacteroidota bacterium]MDP3145699.1 adenine-specific methyltransferase EcoRI family protein [Bacteroidota bacterium]
MANSNLTNARNAKNDEFYTQYHDIQKEIEAYLEYNQNAFQGKTVLMPCDDPEWSNFTKFFAQNFERFGLKKLISTSYAPDSKNYKTVYQPTLFEVNDPQFDEYKTVKNGKIFTLTRDKSGDGKIDVNDLEWQYLKGDGDFNSKEIKKLRDESDIIITNPPFSLFRDFLAWVVEAEKQFLIIGNMNAITYKELFPHIKENKVWLGATNFNKGMYFKVPSDFVYADTYKFEKEQNGEKVNRVPGVCWFTNIDHGRRHQPMPLMTMEDNLKFSKHKEIKGKKSYDTYTNFDAIEVPFADAIPSDYNGLMGVPISFLDKYCPEQFDIIGSNLTHGIPMSEVAKKGTFAQGGPSFYTDNGDGTFKRIYTRILIKHKNVKK